MKKILTIILIILIIVAVITGAMWLITRKKASNAGKTPTTFKEFLSTDTGLTPPDENENPLDGNFIDENNNGINDADESSSQGGSDDTDPGTRTSSFNGTPLNPSSSGSGSGSGGGNTGNIPNGSGSGDEPIDPTDTTPTIGTIPTRTLPIKQNTFREVCSAEDTNINFTSEELAKLTALQNRFYAIASSLHDDADVATEKANMDTFIIKELQLVGLTKYVCEDEGPKLAAAASTPPIMKRRVATPFWSDNTQVFGFIYDGVKTSKIYEQEILGVFGNNTTNDRYSKIPSSFNLEYARSRIERIFRLNLW